MCYDDALYKFTFYLLTYKRTNKQPDANENVISLAEIMRECTLTAV